MEKQKMLIKVKKKKDSPIIKFLKKWSITRMQCLINFQVIQNVGRYGVALFYQKGQIKETLLIKKHIHVLVIFSYVYLKYNISIKYLNYYNCLLYINLA